MVTVKDSELNATTFNPFQNLKEKPENTPKEYG